MPVEERSKPNLRSTLQPIAAPVVKQRTCLQSLLLICFVVCCLVGIGALGALYWLDNSEAQSRSNHQFDMLAPTKIEPRLALKQLTGDPAAPLALQAINAGHFETAYAILAFDTSMKPTQLAALYQQLGRGYQNQERTAEARQLYLVMRAIAVLEPTLNTNQRFELLLQSASGLIDADQTDAAFVAAQQAKFVGAETADLLPAQRSQFFAQLQPIARQLGGDRSDDRSAPKINFAREIDELARNPFLSPTGSAISSRRATLGAAFEPDPVVAIAVANRQQAANALIERLMFLSTIAGNNGARNNNSTADDIGLEREAVAKALLAEDQARQQYYSAAVSGSLSEGISLNQQLALLADHRQWLALKTRIALGGVGLTLVPEWEANTEFLLDELSTITINYAAVLNRLIELQPSEIEQAELRVERLYWLALQLERGLYPRGVAPQIMSELRLAEQMLQQQGFINAFPILYESTTSPPGFIYYRIGS